MGSPPVIGITVDSEPAGGSATQPWYALRQNYCAAVARGGGLPVLLPHAEAEVQRYAGIIDGLVVSGGDFDVDPALFGAAVRHASVTTKDARTGFEMAITQAALAAGKPILGICGGQQLLNVVLGGTLIQHIPDTVVSAVAHEQEGPRDRPGHSVRVLEGTLLHRIVGVNEIAVNSAHHQAAQEVGEGVIVNALAPDGVIEGIEYVHCRFCLGVQWHPEYELSEGDSKLFAAFAAAAAEA